MLLLVVARKLLGLDAKEPMIDLHPRSFWEKPSIVSDILVALLLGPYMTLRHAWWKDHNVVLSLSRLDLI